MESMENWEIRRLSNIEKFGNILKLSVFFLFKIVKLTYLCTIFERIEVIVLSPVLQLFVGVLGRALFSLTEEGL